MSQTTTAPDDALADHHQPPSSSGSPPSSGSSDRPGEVAEGGSIDGVHGRWRVPLAAATSLLIAGSLVLRFWTRSPLWLDEALTVNIARLPLDHIQGALKQDGAPPLYYVLLHFWMKLFGQSDGSTRALSGLFSVATLPVAWVAARRYAGRSFAWAMVALLASAPFAVYYGTEVRMYSLVMFLTACAVIAVQRALDHPRAGNLIAVAVCVAGLLYSQYWALYLVGTLGLWLLWQAWRSGSELRRHARVVLAAVVVGGVTFAPWLPTFIFQSKYTGTPWSAPPNFAAILSAVTGYTLNQAVISPVGTNAGRLLAVCYFLLGFLGLFGVARDRLHITLDVRTQRRGRPLAFIIGGTLAAAVTGGILSGSAFSPRYAAVVFVPLMFLAALGAMTLIDSRVRIGLLAVACLAGLSISAQNITTERTEAAKVASVLAARATPGDVVAYCPDQLGPALYRLTADDGYRQITFPRDTGPDLVNWVNYKQAATAGDPARFAKVLVSMAGQHHKIWLVWAPGYQGFGLKCQLIAEDLLHTPNFGGHNWLIQNPNKYYEPMSLTQYNFDGSSDLLPTTNMP